MTNFTRPSADLAFSTHFPLKQKAWGRGYPAPTPPLPPLAIGSSVIDYQWTDLVDQEFLTWKQVDNNSTPYWRDIGYKRGSNDDVNIIDPAE